MCIAAFIWQAHPLHPFILLQNRDEYHSRPTKAAEWWEDGEILGGKDEVGGGTWLACSRDGRLAFLTNVLELHSLPQAKSRGQLPLLFLKSRKSPRAFAEELLKEAHQYNGFNLIVADIPSKSMLYVSNRTKGEPFPIQRVSPGLHVLSNAKLDSPWPKAQRLRKSLKEQLNKYGKGNIAVKDVADELMKDTVKADQTRLPGICALDWEYHLSSIFVQVDTPLGRYGTRSTAALTVTASGEVTFYEKYLEQDMWKEHTVKYHIHKFKE